MLHSTTHKSIFFSCEVAQPQGQVVQKSLESQALKLFKISLDTVLENLLQLTLRRQRCWSGSDVQMFLEKV